MNESTRDPAVREARAALEPWLPPITDPDDRKWMLAVVDRLCAACVAAGQRAPTPEKCAECGGRGSLDCDDPQCGDSTWDHYCNAGRKCKACGGKGFVGAAGQRETQGVAWAEERAHELPRFDFQQAWWQDGQKYEAQMCDEVEGAFVRYDDVVNLLAALSVSAGPREEKP